MPDAGRRTLELTVASCSSSSSSNAPGRPEGSRSVRIPHRSTAGNIAFPRHAARATPDLVIVGRDAAEGQLPRAFSESRSSGQSSQGPGVAVFVHVCIGGSRLLNSANNG